MRAAEQTLRAGAVMGAYEKPQNDGRPDIVTWLLEEYPRWLGDARPKEYEKRVVAFFDQYLLRY